MLEPGLLFHSLPEPSTSLTTDGAKTAIARDIPPTERAPAAKGEEALLLLLREDLAEEEE